MGSFEIRPEKGRLDTEKDDTKLLYTLDTDMAFFAALSTLSRMRTSLLSLAEGEILVWRMDGVMLADGRSLCGSSQI